MPPTSTVSQHSSTCHAVHPNEPVSEGRSAGDRRGSARAGIRLLVHSNVFVSVATTSVAITTAVLANLPFELLPLFVVFAATMFVYTLNRLTDLAEDEQNVPGRAAFTRRYGRAWLGLGVVLYVGAVVLALVSGVRGAPFLLAPVAAIFVYSVAGAKRVLLVKNLVVGASWGAIPVWMGVYYGTVASVEIAFLFGYVTAMITIAAAIFDIKDVEGDRAEGIRTVPNVYSPRVTRQAAALATVAIAAVVVAAVAAALVPPRFLALLALNAYVLAYVPFATLDRGPLYYGFVVDGEHVFLAAVVVGLDLLAW